MMMNGMGGFGGFIPPIKQAQGMQQPGMPQQQQPMPGQQNLMQFWQQQQQPQQGGMMSMLQNALRARGGGFAGGTPWMMGR